MGRCIDLSHRPSYGPDEYDLDKTDSDWSDGDDTSLAHGSDHNVDHVQSEPDLTAHSLDYWDNLDDDQDDCKSLPDIPRGFYGNPYPSDQTTLSRKDNATPTLRRPESGAFQATACARLFNLTTFDLEQYYIGQMPLYVAASHVWSEGLFPITSDNRKQTLGMRMVALALGKVSHKYKINFFWVDTWCIDQTNQDEKLHQIPLMKDIYRDAEAVVITLGQRFSFSQFEWNSAIFDCRHILAAATDRSGWTNTITDVQGLMTAVSARAAFSCIQMLCEVATSQWARRVWTAQEYLLARSEVLIGTDLRPLRLRSKEINSVNIFCTLHYIGAIKQPWFRYESISPNGTSMLTNLNNMVDLKRDIALATNAILLAENRSCTKPTDEIYGLMGATGVTINPTGTDDLEKAWTLWWTEALKSGHVEFALFIPARASTECYLASPWNCAMPPYQDRFALSPVVGMTDVIQGLHVENGVLGFMGRKAGVCYVEAYLGDRLLYTEIRRMGILVGHDQSLALRLCLALAIYRGTGRRSRSNAEEAADRIHRYHKLRRECRQKPTRKLQRELTNLRKRNDDCWVNGVIPLRSPTYLGYVENSRARTEVLIEASEADLDAEDVLLALDIQDDEDRPHSSKILMIVRRPQHPGSSFHKIGITQAVWFHNHDATDNCLHYGHVHIEPPERLKIGGNACSYCAKKQEADEVFGRLWSQEIEQERFVLAKGKQEIQSAPTSSLRGCRSALDWMPS